jgi:flagellar hook assembly protein FlgD
MELYAKDNYQDEWDGTTNSGEELPDGTYYYIIEFNSGNKKAGWVYLLRK